MLLNFDVPVEHVEIVPLYLAGSYLCHASGR